MRILTIILDLFVLLTIYAVVLYFAALGNSAPHKSASQISLVEVDSTLRSNGGLTVPATRYISFRADLVDPEGNPVSGTVLPNVTGSADRSGYIIYNAPPEARLRVTVDEIKPGAFEFDKFLVQLERRYPTSGRTKPSDSFVGQAVDYSIEVEQ